MWDVEYTDEFAEWWQQLSIVEQEAVAYSVELLTQLGPTLPYPIAVALMAQDTIICANSEPKLKENRFVRYMPLTLDVPPYCLSQAIKPETNAGMTLMYQSLINSMTTISSSLTMKDYSNG